MFEILMFLFENYMEENVSLKTDPASITVELEGIGFDRYQIDRALNWIQGLNEFTNQVNTQNSLSDFTIRHYSPDEIEKIDSTGRGFLIYLQQLGILDSVTREIVIDRVMALDHYEVTPGKIKWVVLMVLFNQPDKKSALSILQNMILADAFGVLH